MATKIKCNFGEIFANFATEKELKEVANEICGEVKSAYDNRIKELKDGKEVAVKVEVEASASGTKPASKTSRAKEMAAKLKEEKAKPAPKEKKSETKPAKAKETTEKSTESDALIAITDKEAIKKLGLKFEKYNEKCWALCGTTKPLRKELTKFKGVYNSHLTGGEGWVFRTEQVAEVAKALGLKVKVA